MSEPLPPYVNLYQAEQLAARHLRGGKPIESATDLQPATDLVRDALFRAKLVGCLGDGTEIPAMAWSRKTSHPLDHQPDAILIETKALSRLLTDVKLPDTTLYDWDLVSRWYKGAVASTPGLSIKQAARDLRVRYEKEIGCPPSEDRIKVYVRRWRDRQTHSKP